MTDWTSLCDRIRDVQTQILRFAPYRDICVVPHPSASEQALAAVEARIGRALPPSYRSFLSSHDGWPRFFEGATLLGTANLGKRMYEDLARAVFEAAETPVPRLGPPARLAPRPALIPFGIDLSATTLFAFNPDMVGADGEYEVVAWVNEIGVRRNSFPEFLEFVLDMVEAELDDHVAAAPIRQSA